MSNYILQIDTATEICSVSISRNGEFLAEKSSNEANMHASALTGYISLLLSELNLSFSDLSAIAVSMGPGSYTGLRIGVSTAKGLCYALNIPLLGINTLEAMFEGYALTCALQENSMYVPMLDARRMEVYMSIFDNSGRNVKETAAVIIEKDTFDAFKFNQIVLFGSGAIKLGSLFAECKNIKIDTNYRHSSAYLSTLAYRKLQSGIVEDLIYFEPFYLKEFVASIPKKRTDS